MRMIGPMMVNGQLEGVTVYPETMAHHIWHAAA